MTDKKISELTALAAADIVNGDRFVVEDVSVSSTKSITFEALRDGLGRNGIARFSVSPVADGAVNNGECYIYIDTAASPQTFVIKAKDGSGNVYTSTLALD